HTDRPLVSRAINDLVEKGLVTRRSAAEDRRRALVDLTEKGRELHQELFPVTAEINRTVLSVLSAEELRVLDSALDRLLEAAVTLNQEYPLTEKADRRRGGSRQYSHKSAALVDIW